MKNKTIFFFSDAFQSAPRVVHSSLSDFAPDLARDEEFPLFPSKLGVITRFRDSSAGLIATIETEWPSLTSTTRGEIALCQDAEEITREKTQLLIARCEALASELVSQADRLRATLNDKMLHLAGVNSSDYATSLEESGRARVYEIAACDRQRRTGTDETRDDGAGVISPSAARSSGQRSPRATTSPKPHQTRLDNAPPRASKRGLDPNALSAILADED